MMRQIGFSKIYHDSSLFYSSKHGLILWFMYIEHMIITIGHKVEMRIFFFFFWIHHLKQHLSQPYKTNFQPDLPDPF
jgi:hypothetical protein